MPNTWWLSCGRGPLTEMASEYNNTQAHPTNWSVLPPDYSYIYTPIDGISTKEVQSKGV